VKKAMDSFQIRQKFLEYFAQNGHTIVPSSSLIPAEDPTLLFTNAGMNQFKDIFLGKEKRSYTRATTCQKCVRAGGKHNDLDAVGFTERHLTFFEMLGNFSFGDYFKKEAISYAWNFLTKEVHLPIDQLYVSVYKDDNESYTIWNTIIGIPAERIIKLGEKDNFWQMGDTGPCGPCTEIYIDRGKSRGCQLPNCAPGCDCSRFTEIWNLVFMQFDRQANGELRPLAATGVDTGMGLERLCMVMQGKDNVYQSDIFTTLIARIQEITGVDYKKADAYTQAAFHVLCDHVRSSSLLITDGCTPSNEGRGYVLRKIIRRAALFSQKLSTDLCLLPKLAETFISLFAPVYKELETSKSLILNLLTNEVEKFNTNLLQGQTILQRYIEENKKRGLNNLTGEQVFKLYDTYGFPPELTRVLANEQNLSLDLQGFESEMKKQQEQSGKKGKDGAEHEFIVAENVSTKFVGYQTLTATSKVIFVNYIDGSVWIITEESPFYAESGGQVSDTATVTINNVTYPVADLKKIGNPQKPAIAVKLTRPATETAETIKPGDMATCTVDEYTRANTMKNHTATHLLQAALMKTLGQQIKQAGSLVSGQHFRFDFNHHEALSKEQIEAIESLVNQYIMADVAVNIFETTLEDAKSKGVIAFFGEKYNPERVRVIQIPGISSELCGGTHVERTGIIGCFKITGEAALSSGTRRITGVTGPEAIKLFQNTFATVKKISEDFKVKVEDAYVAVQKLNANYQESLNAIKQLKKQISKAQIPTWQQQMQLIGTLPFLYLEFDDAGGDELKNIAQELEKAKPGFYFLVSKESETGRCNFIGYLAKGFEKELNLKTIAQNLKDSCDWRGGGSGNLIQGGGTQLPQDLQAKILGWIKK
jgi:alanyl-tRNA synthetase